MSMHEIRNKYDGIHRNHLSQRIKMTQSQRLDQKLSRRLDPFELIWAFNQLLEPKCIILHP